MRTVFYKRSGERVSRAHVRRSQMQFVHAKGTTGKLGELNVSIQPTLAEAIERMREEDYADWSGSYTWKRI